ncbi:MAG: FRG domain-containing protein [bacterium]
MDKRLPAENEITSLANYMAFVEAAQQEIRESNSDDLLLFRGQSVDEPLLPKMARLHMVHRKWDIWQRHALLETESRMLSEFKRRARPFTASVPETEWEWMALAQHHGMDTRLLDWTSNALVGLYFALEEDGSKGQRVVWVLRATPEDIVAPTSHVAPFSLPTTKFYRPSLLSPRIIAQDGWLSVHKHMTTKDTFIPLEQNRAFKNCLRKLKIRGERHRHLPQLDLCGVNRAALFPGLDGLCTYLNWKRGPDNWVHISMPKELPSANTPSKNDVHRIAHPRRARKR